jgi:hypothetical protein
MICYGGLAEMIDLKRFAGLISDRIKNVWQRPLSDLNEDEIKALIESAWSCPDGTNTPPGGWEKPRIENDTLMIGFRTHPKYRWWTPDGQSVYQTLKELDAPQHVVNAYVPEWFQE